METNRTCPLTTRQIVDEYFIENRTRILDIAAFLDRLERSCDGADAGADYRVQALRRALRALCEEQGLGRAREVQMIFSDPTLEPKQALDGKSAYGAWNPATAEPVGEAR